MNYRLLALAMVTAILISVGGCWWAVHHGVTHYRQCVSLDTLTEFLSEGP